MHSDTIKQANKNSEKFGEFSEAYLKGFDRGYNCASWQDLPELGAKVWTESDGKLTVDEDNQWDIVQSQAYEAEANSRQFSPFEFIASEFNGLDEEEEGKSEEAWEAFEEGISDGIHANIHERSTQK